MTLRQCQVFFLICCAEIISHAPAGFPLRFPRLCDKIILFAGMVELADTLDLGSNGIAVQVQVLLPAPYYDVTLIAVRREKNSRFLGSFSLFVHQL